MNRRNLIDDIDERIDNVRRELIERVAEPLSSRWSSRMGALGTRSPATDLADEETRFNLALELPGVEKNDIQLDVEENRVHVRADAHHEEEESRKGYLHRERSSTSFERYITLPEAVDRDQVKATFRNGILSVTLPKAAGAKRKAKHVDIE